jgi:ribosomal protein S18 acetylase RimI-like enzyme
MSHTAGVLIEPVDPFDQRRGAELLALQQAAYAVEAELIGDSRIPALTQTLDELRADRLTWLAALEQDELVGAIGWTETVQLTDLDRLVVHPLWHRRGLGRALVRELLARCGTPLVVVSTGRDNLPARRLYQGLGFRWLQDVEAIPGLWVSRYEWGRADQAGFTT